MIHPDITLQLQLQGEKQQVSDRHRAEVALHQAEEMIHRISTLERELTAANTSLKVKNKIIDDLYKTYNLELKFEMFLKNEDKKLI